jgi:hypothetical protein
MKFNVVMRVLCLLLCVVRNSMLIGFVCLFFITDVVLWKMISNVNSNEARNVFKRMDLSRQILI